MYSLRAKSIHVIMIVNIGQEDSLLVTKGYNA